MATRLLLTLLALLAGLAAQLTPAQARVAGASEVSVEIASDDVRLVARHATPIACMPANLAQPADRTTPISLNEALVPAVLVGIDRARE